MDIKTLEEFEKLIKSCQKLGVKSIKVDANGFSAELATEALLPESSYQKKKKEKEMKDIIPDPIAEQFKLDNWSSYSGEVS